MAISHGVREDVSIQRFLNELLLEQAIRNIEMLGDNKTSLTLTKDRKSLNCTKHIDVMHYYIRGLVDNRELEIEWIPNSLMLADRLIKAWPARPFKKHQDEWGLEVWQSKRTNLVQKQKEYYKCQKYNKNQKGQICQWLRNTNTSYDLCRK